MAKFLFVTKQEYHPERVQREDSEGIGSWSCPAKVRENDEILVHVVGKGIHYRWRATSDAEPDPKWKHMCEVEFIEEFDPPIHIREIKDTIKREEWAAPYVNFQGSSFPIHSEDVFNRILELRSINTNNLSLDEDQEEDQNENQDFGEEFVDPEALNEGAVKKITVNAHERNPKARRECIKHYGTSCSVCGIDFGGIYGSIAEGFIHVHHLKPLSRRGEEYEVNPTEDLRPVCPNCHAVIHLSSELRSIEEVKSMLVNAKRKNKKS